MNSFSGARMSSPSSQSRPAGAFFDRFADTFDTFYDGQRRPLMQWIDRRFRSDMFERFRMTFDRLEPLDGRHVLDIGCGSGPYLAEALRRGARRVTGLDPAPRMLELSRERLQRLGLAERADFVRGFFPDVELMGRYDAAIVMGVMDYVSEARLFLEGLRSTVAGPSVVSFPSKHWMRTPLRKVRYWLRRCPLYFYDVDQIRSLGAACGFSSTEVEKISGAGMDYHVRFTP